MSHSTHEFVIFMDILFLNLLKVSINIIVKKLWTTTWIDNFSELMLY